MLPFKIVAVLVWLFLCVVLGVRRDVKLNDHLVHPLLAPLVVLFIGICFVTVGVIMLAPWIWLMWP